jgi:hypothetical protein
MPYIKQTDRSELTHGHRPPETAGELNFLLSTLFNDYIDKNGLSYDQVNKLVGVLECTKLELYRRVAVPYENVKLAENGDVYDGR